jgi:hypothetical protein
MLFRKPVVSSLKKKEVVPRDSQPADLSRPYYEF